MSGLSVLVVDDEAGMRETVADILTGRGYEVATASNGDDALSQIRAGAFSTGRTIFSSLRIFLPISTASFLIGAAYAAWTIATQHHVTNSSVLLIVLAVIVFLVGLVSEQISAQRFNGDR